MDQKDRPDLPADASVVAQLWELAGDVVRAIAPNPEDRKAWADAFLRMKEAQRMQAEREAETLAYITERRRIEDAQKRADELRIQQARKRGAAAARKNSKAMGEESVLTLPPVNARGPAIVAKLRELGFDPGNLPPWKPGATNPARAAVFQALPSPPWTESTFKRAWESLSDVLVYAKPSGND